MIKLENISKSYINKNRTLTNDVLKSINCSINNCEMIAIKGRSGCGKSTMINILSGLIKPDSGNYYFNSTNITKLSIKEIDNFREKNIGMIVQDCTLINSLTARENILLPVKYRKYNKLIINKELEELSKYLNIEDCLDKKISELSGGESQRIAIARALIKKPKLILADEPTGALDSNSEKEVLKLLKMLKEKGNTIIISTHSNVVSQYCDKVFEIVNGIIKKI